MSTTGDFDRIAASWIADGPTELNDRVLDAALHAVHLTHQRRRGAALWRTRTLNPPLRLAVAAAVFSVVAIGVLALAVGPKGGVGAPSPFPSPGAAASEPPLPTLDATFISPSNGYRVSYPTGWKVTQGTGTWPLGTERRPGNPVSDAIVTPSGTLRVRLSGASLALPDGMTMDQFRAFAGPYGSPFPSGPCALVAPLPTPLTINAVVGPGGSLQPLPAVISINGCDALAELGGHIYSVDVVAGRRGYTFTIDGHITTADAVAWLAAITLDPASATAATGAPSPSASK
jgi:hypothetical protein